MQETNFFSDMQTFLENAMEDARALLNAYDQSKVEAIRNWLRNDSKSYGDKAQGIKKYLPAIKESISDSNYQKLFDSVDAIVKILELASLLEQLRAIITKAVEEGIEATTKKIPDINIINAVNPELLNFLTQLALVQNGHPLDEKFFKHSDFMGRVLMVLQSDSVVTDKQKTSISTVSALEEQIVWLQTMKQYLEAASKQALEQGQTAIKNLSVNIRINCWQEICNKLMLTKIGKAVADLQGSLQKCSIPSDKANKLILGQEDGQLDFELQDQLQSQLEESVKQQASFQTKAKVISEDYEQAIDAIEAPMLVMEKKIIELQNQKKELEEEAQKVKDAAERDHLLGHGGNKKERDERYTDVNGTIFTKIKKVLVASDEFKNLKNYADLYGDKKEVIDFYLKKIDQVNNLDELYNAVQDEGSNEAKTMRENTGTGLYRLQFWNNNGGKSTTDTLAIRLNIELNRLVKTEKAKAVAENAKNKTQETPTGKMENSTPSNQAPKSQGNNPVDSPPRSQAELQVDSGLLGCGFVR
jgi:hypothetical protein